MFRWLLIDGYNLMHADPDFRDRRGGTFESRRTQFVSHVAKLAPLTAHRATLVFDGRAAAQEPAVRETRGPMDILYSSGSRSADGEIERLVHQDPRPEGIVVVTDDLAEQDSVRAAGAHVLGCAAWLEECRQRERDAVRRCRRRKPFRSPRLGDLFPE
ncbi:NYN domain-containing protein [Kiritimatiella glycovorans]|uniref:Putative RNA-binding protein containing a PIN domain protein n=1 Tax=Kiritimatiella glycovorans TaxID=1307763 RepID=A0A0G3EH50_9BACT|nr:NYN domain-containing protein [Kiritimatiella glycovorans]AKJ64747.1 putative RNA-binding protein containing a PIN domain protein [Kiritimatiella glycovorans]